MSNPTGKGGFKKGQSGNPAGKPKGVRHKATQAVEQLLEGEAEELTRKAIALAKGGDMTALKLCLDRICPPSRSRTVQFTLPKIETADDVTKAFGDIMQAMTDGELTIDETHTITGILDAKRRSIETAELEKRVTQLEDAR